MAVSVLLFAFATIVCWAHYGKESVIYLKKMNPPVTLYVLLYSLFVFIGAITTPAYTWLFADLALGTMTLINVTVLLFSRREIYRETNAFFKF